jgi:hypothetical protein
MSLLVHSGYGTSDMSAGSVRIDLSDYLAASLLAENNFLGNLKVGSDFVGQSFSWPEDRLNPNFITEIGTVNNSADPVNLVMTAADASILDIGMVLADTTAGGLVSGEQVQVVGITVGSPNTTVSVSRSYGGTTIASHASGAVWRIVGAPTVQNSPLGRDLSRSRLTKTNIKYTQAFDVNISQDVLSIAEHGYTPGVDDELYYQFNQRLTEKLNQVNNTLLFGRVSAGVINGSQQGDYSTLAGLTSWLDGTLNTTATPVNAGGAPFSIGLLNDINVNIQRQGAVADWALFGLNGVGSAARIYGDQIRIEQSETDRGFNVKRINTESENSLRLLYDQAIPDTAPNGVLYVCDSGLITLNFAAGAAFYTISSPSFNDGDAVRGLMKMSLGVRNSGTDVGFAHQLVTGLSW